MSVKRSELGQLDPIASGAVGTVYRTPFRLRGSPHLELAYKEFNSALPAAQLKRAANEFASAVNFRSRLAPSEQVDLDARTAWPVAVVTDGGRVTGGLMPLIPPDFFVSLQPPHLNGRGERKARDLAFLSSPTQRNLTAGFSKAQLREFDDLVVRAAIVAQLVYSVAWLHKRGLVYGDISLKNAVFALNQPRVTLIDCDAVALQGDSSRRQLHSPSFLPPECLSPGSNAFARGSPHLQDVATDVYKLGLCVVRGLSKGRGATQEKRTDHLVGDLPKATLGVIDRALDPNPRARPAAKELFEALVAFVGAKCAPPAINSFYPASTVVPRGTDLVFVWDVDVAKLDPATRATLHGPNGFTARVDPASGTHTIKAQKSGVYELTVSKRGASVAQQSEPVQIFDLPEFDIAGSASIAGLAPSIPSLAPVEIASVLRSLPQRPSVEIGADFVPALSTPSADPILHQLSALAGTVSSVEVVNQAIEHYTPPLLTEVTQLGQVVDSLGVGGQLVGSAVVAAQDGLKASLQDATAASMADAVKRIADGVARKHAALLP